LKSNILGGDLNEDFIIINNHRNKKSQNYLGKDSFGHLNNNLFIFYQIKKNLTIIGGNKMNDTKMNILDVNEICIALNRAHSTVRNYLRKGDFKTAFQKSSLNKWYVKTEEVIKFINNSNNTVITK